MAALDVGWAGRLIAADPKLKEEYAQAFRDWADPAGGPIRAKPGDLVQELIDNAGTWDYVSQAPSLKDRSVLLVAAKSDYPESGVEPHTALANAIHAAGGTHVKVVLYEDFHEFNSHRIALSDLLIAWLSSDCARSQLSAAQ
jgi:hypothetical protein